MGFRQTRVWGRVWGFAFGGAGSIARMPVMGSRKGLSTTGTDWAAIDVLALGGGEGGKKHISMLVRPVRGSRTGWSADFRCGGEGDTCTKAPCV